jgi:hypothetical protein
MSFLRKWGLLPESGRRGLSNESSVLAEQGRADAYVDTLPRERIDERDLCGSGERSLLYRKTTPAGFLDLVCCNTCGLWYLAQCVEHHHLEEHGKHGGGEGGRGGEEADDAACERLYAEYETYAKQTLDYLQGRIGGMRGLRVLDLAGGVGAFVKVFRDAGADIIGLEHSDTFREFASARKGLDLLSDEKEIRGVFDLVYGIRYLNHYRSPTRELARISRFIGPRGYLFMTNKDSAHDIRRKGPWRGIKADHPYLFTEQSTRLYLRKCGYRVRDLKVDLVREHDFGTLNHIHLLATAGDAVGDIDFPTDSALKAQLEYQSAVSQYLHYQGLGISE